MLLEDGYCFGYVLFGDLVRNIISFLSDNSPCLLETCYPAF